MLLGVVGCRWMSLDVAGRCWTSLDVAGRHRMLLDVVGRRWMSLDVAGCCWMSLDVVGCRWMLLDVCRWMMLDVVGQSPVVCRDMFVSVTLSKVACAGACGMSAQVSVWCVSRGVCQSPCTTMVC